MARDVCMGSGREGFEAFPTSMGTPRVKCPVCFAKVRRTMLTKSVSAHKPPRWSYS